MHRITLLLLVLTFIGISFFASGFVASADAGVVPLVKPTPVPRRPARVAKPRGQTAANVGVQTEAADPDGFVGDVLEGTGIKARKVKDTPGSSSNADNSNRTNSTPVTTQRRKGRAGRQNTPMTNGSQMTVPSEQSNGLMGDVFEGTGIKARKVKGTPGSSSNADNSNRTNSTPVTTQRRKGRAGRQNAPMTNGGTMTVPDEQPTGITGDVLEGTGIKASKERDTPGSSATPNNQKVIQSQPTTTTVKAKKPRKRKP